MSLLQSLFNQHNFFSENMATQMDWKETPHAHKFEIDLPGLRKEDVKLEVREDRILHVSAEKKEEPEDKDDKWHCRERTDGSFLRQYWLPENAKVDEIKASMRDRILTLTVPLKDEMKKKPKQKSSSVEISGDDIGHAPKGHGRFICILYLFHVVVMAWCELICS